MKLKKLFAMSLAFIITGILSPISQNISDNVISTAYAEPEKMITYNNNDESNSIFDIEQTIIDEKNNITYVKNENERELTLVKCDPSNSGQIDIPDMFHGLTVTKIGPDAFRNCNKITGITIPDSVRIIYSSAFENCENLKNVSFGDSLETIEFRAFYNCTRLEQITIPDSVKIIGNDAFECCENLKSLTLGQGLEIIGLNAFRLCYKLEKVVIPDSVTEIGSNAFAYSGITSAKLSEKIKKIEFATFSNCTKLKSITIPSTVEIIDDSAFHRCISFESLVCGKNVSKFNLSSIQGCTNMKSLTIENPKCEFILIGGVDGLVTVDTLNSDGNITDKIVIKGYKNLTAETVAKKYGFKFSALPSYGDPNADGKINSVDASEILSIYAKNAQNKSKPSSDDLECCDINKDGAVNAVDASYVLAYYAYTATNKNPVSLTDYMKIK